MYQSMYQKQVLDEMWLQAVVLFKGNVVLVVLNEPKSNTNVLHSIQQTVKILLDEE